MLRVPFEHITDASHGTLRVARHTIDETAPLERVESSKGAEGEEASVWPALASVLV